MYLYDPVTNCSVQTMLVYWLTSTILFFVCSLQAMLVYWLTSNLFSLLQVLFLKIPGLKPFFKIPEMVIHEKSSLDPPKKKKFIEGFTESKHIIVFNYQNQLRVEIKIYIYSSRDNLIHIRI